MFRIPVNDTIWLGLLEERHAPCVFELVSKNRAHLRRWLPWVEQTGSVHDSREFVRSTLEDFAHSRGVTTGIFLRGQLVGIVSYNRLDSTHRTGEIGYWLDASHQGQGIMTRACKALIAYGFTELGLNRIVIRCDVDNRRSCAVAERLGFTREGVLRQSMLRNGEFRDMALYSLLKREWS